MKKTSTTASFALPIVATLTMSVSYVDRQTMAVLAPQVTKNLGIDNTHYGLLVSAFAVAYLLFTPISGTVADRFGARYTMAAALAAWSLVAGLHAVAATFATMFVLRFLLGAAEAPSFPSAAQAIRRALPDANRPLAIGLLFTGGSIGAIAAAKLAPALEAAFGYRAAFVGTALLGVLWLPAWWITSAGHGLERAADPPPPREPDDPSYRVNAAPEAVGVPSIWSVVTSPEVLRSIVAVVGVAPVLMLTLNWTAKYLVDVWGVSKTSIGNHLMLPPLFYDVGALGFGYWQSRREAKNPTPPGARPRTHRDLFVLGGLLVSAVVLTPLATSALTATLALTVGACGVGGVYVLVTADMLGRIPVARASVAGGMTAAAQSISHVIAGPLVGWSIDRTHGYTAALVGVGLFVFAPMGAFLVWPLSPLSPRARSA